MFLTAGGDWTPDTEAAMEFESGSDALDYSQKHHLRQKEVYYHFDNPRFDFSSPLNDESEPR